MVLWAWLTLPDDVPDDDSSHGYDSDKTNEARF